MNVGEKKKLEHTVKTKEWQQEFDNENANLIF